MDDSRVSVDFEGNPVDDSRCEKTLVFLTASVSSLNSIGDRKSLFLRFFSLLSYCCCLFCCPFLSSQSVGPAVTVDWSWLRLERVSGPVVRAHGAPPAPPSLPMTSHAILLLLPTSVCALMCLHCLPFASNRLYVCFSNTFLRAGDDSGACSSGSYTELVYFSSGCGYIIQLKFLFLFILFFPKFRKKQLNYYSFLKLPSTEIGRDLRSSNDFVGVLCVCVYPYNMLQEEGGWTSSKFCTFWCV